MSRSLLNTFALLALGTLIALTTACGKDSSTTPTPPPPPQPTQPPPPPPTPVATRITITPDSVTLTEIGQMVQLTAQVYDQNDNVITGALVTWRSLDFAVASVNSSTGVVTARKSGTTPITARSGDAVQFVEVKVVQTPGSIVIESEKTTLTAIGETHQLSARVLDTNKRTIEGADVNWQSGNADVARVNASGLLTAVNRGVAAITATSGEVSGSIEMTVMQVPASIVIDPEEATLAAAGDTVQLTATVSDRNGHTIEDAAVTWESGDDAIATIDDQGLVTATDSGTVEITARSGDASSTLSVTVKGEVTDREVLTILYHATKGEHWTNKGNWLSDAPLGEWYGIKTNFAGEVTRIELPQNNLRGPIPAELCYLSSLEGLELPWNKLTGNIPPELGLLTNLILLWLSSNELTGNIPPELSQLTNLSLMWLGENRLTGGIPPEFGQLTSLRGLSIHDTELTGVIPSELGQLTSLTVISLLNNKMTGIIPPELGQLYSLEYLELQGNEFTGTIPHELGQTKLVRLGLSSNKLTGDIPLELTQLRGLTDLSLSSNRLTGEIPPELAQLTRLTSLRLGKNRLTGTIPPELAQLTELTILDLENNRLDGIIPPELAELTKLTYLDLGHNALTGTIPPEFGRLSKLRSLWLNQNLLTGTIPTVVGELESLAVLAIDGNRLMGGIPDELGQLSSLEWLWLADNPGLTGPLPDSFSGLENMRFLTLSNTGLCVPPTSLFRTWIDGIQDARGVLYCSGP